MFSPKFNLGHGGGTIKRKSIMAVSLLLILALSISTSTSFAATNTSSTNSSQITTNTANSSSTNSTNIAAGSAGSSEVNFTSAQVNDASKRVNTFIQTNSRLPNYVTIGSYKVTMPQFLQLMAQSIVNINSGSKSSVALGTVSSPSNPTETVTSGNIYKSEYITIAKSILSTINTTGTAPSYVSSSLGNVKFESLVYSFSKILNYHQTNSRLPNYVSVKAWSSSITSSTSSSVQTILDAIGKAEAKYGDVQGISDVATFVKLGYGDCWADSMWLYKQLYSAGVQARIMGYVNGGYGVGYRHAWVQINIGSGWVNWNYKGYNSQHYGDVGTGTPYVLIGPGVASPSILSTGY